ncbi:MAG TPA: saccharopine dehydrogenase NADP-binding domain-containing protein [Chitinophagaceae bacterium]
MNSNTFLLYGANGYTGRLIANYAAQYNLQPVLAGRSEDAIKGMAEQLKLSYKIVDLANTSQLIETLQEIKVVVHAAGPFAATARPMIDACLQTGTHYLDINGDISVFEQIKSCDALAKEKNIMLLPGVGFDVVPTDCMALQLKNKLPDATHLKLAFASIGGAVSHGTAMTIVNKLGEGGAARENSRIVKKPLGKKGMWVDFGSTKLFVMSIPWGDVSTAYFTTGIPNIESYTAVKPIAYNILKLQKLFNWLLRTEGIKNIIRKKIKQRPAGPDDEKRSKAKSLVWGEAKDAMGKTVTGHFTCADGYTLTALSSLIIAKKVLGGNFKPGYQTPASCYGEALIWEIPGTVKD